METKKKIIRDVVHGYIKIDALTEKLINTYNFQRLKDIRQLTAQYVYHEKEKEQYSATTF